jgi:chromosome segregation ATPase
MKDKGLILVLLLVAAGLGVALIVVNKKSDDESKTAASQLANSSNTIVSLTKDKAELQDVNQTLESKLTSISTDYSNKLALSDANLRNAQANLEKANAEAKAEAAAQTEKETALIAQKDQKISELESQNQTLDKQAADLRAAITNLQNQIADVKHNLGSAVKDRDMLLAELRTLQAQKDLLEKQFNSLPAVREQVRKLKIEQVIARRLDWMRRGIYDAMSQKGGQRLAEHYTGPPPAGSAGATVDLREKGGVTIRQLPPATNGPPPK